MKLPEKEYLRFDELAIKWACTSRDLFHLIATNKLIPSVLVGGKFDVYQVGLDEDGLEVRPYYLEECICANEFVSGIYYLNWGGRVEVHRCAFRYFSEARNIGDGDMVYGLGESAEIELVQESKTVRISSNIIFVRDEIARFEKDHTASAIDGKPADEKALYQWGNHKTKLLGHLSQAAIKFWNLYDPSDTTTAPTNEQVENWLIEQGVSRRNAEVMATILRADNLPTGRRK